MPLENNLVLANRFSMAFRRAMGEPIEMSRLIRDAGYYKECVGRGLASGDAQLVELSIRVNENENFSLAIPSVQSGARLEPVSEVHPLDWERMEGFAVEVSGPVGAILVRRVRSKSPATLSAAIDAVAVGLGEQGGKFRQLAKVM